MVPSGPPARASCRLGVALLAIGLAGCDVPNPDAATYLYIEDGSAGAMPDFGQFAADAANGGVHVFLEKTCGTLDCHGQVGRPFRLYSAGGLRDPDGGLDLCTSPQTEVPAGPMLPGSGPDTPKEICENYLSVVGLQPEDMQRVRVGEELPTHLLIVSKPLTDWPGHKGGREMTATGDPATCLEDWLIGGVTVAGQAQMFDMGACQSADLLP